MGGQVSMISVQGLVHSQMHYLLLRYEEVVKDVFIECIQAEPLKVHKLDEGMLILIFGEGVDVTVVCNCLVALDMWLGWLVEMKCYVATAKQVKQILGFEQARMVDPPPCP